MSLAMNDNSDSRTSLLPILNLFCNSKNNSEYIKSNCKKDSSSNTHNFTKKFSGPSKTKPKKSSNRALQKENRLLTADEEKEYGKLVQCLLKIRSLEENVLKIWGCNPSPTQLANLLKIDPDTFVSFRNACEKARQHMIDCNLRLVVSVAKKNHAKKLGIELHDLVTVGIGGLTRAVEKFEPRKGYKFSTYAHWWIRQAVDRYVLERRAVKVPVHLWEILSKIRKAQRALRLKLNREPTHGEIGTLLGIDRDRVEHVMLAYQDTESLDANFTDSSTAASPLEEIIVIESPENDGQENLNSLELPNGRLQKMVETLLEVALTDREAEILRMRYGLDDGFPKTLDEIGARFQVTRERVRQIETKVGRKLKLSKQREILQRDLVGEFSLNVSED
jgi:RNA polymerase sigma factor (sigma-70 family)